MLFASVVVVTIDISMTSTALPAIADAVQGDLTIEREVDRIYLQHSQPIHLSDGQRTLEICRSGSASVVLWNPWQDKARKLDNFPADGYRTMLCIEAANAAADARTLQPGEEHTLSCSIRQI